MAKKILKNNITTIIVGILVTVGGWALFSLMRISSERILTNFGVTDELNQALILVLFVLVMLIILGFSFREALKSLKVL